VSTGHIRLMMLGALLAGTWGAVEYAQAAGLPVKKAAAEYPVHGSTGAGGLTIAAGVPHSSELPAGIRRQLGERWLVLEVALFPDAKARIPQVTLDQFQLEVIGKNGVSYVNPLPAEGIWQAPRHGGVGGASIPHGSVGAETTAAGPGRRTGVSGDVFGGVGGGDIDGPGVDGNFDAVAGTYALPLGRVPDAVAGYVYFRLPERPAKKTQFTLQFRENGGTVKLDLPAAVKPGKKGRP
jgi:hypothetical protein